jgi:TonB family protein
MKTFITLLLLCATCVAFAQKQNVYFLKKDGTLVDKRDSADFIRIVREPDSGSKLYNVMEYYLKGQKKLIGKSSVIDPIVLEGLCMTYYESGQRKALVSYKKNRPFGDEYTFFSNGKLYTTERHSNPDSVDAQKKPVNPTTLIITCNDTTGTPLVTNGNGHYVGYDSDFKYVFEQGEVKGGEKNGEWKGKSNTSKYAYTETYDNGKLINGNSVDKDGNTYQYTVPEASAEFKGGIEKFYRFLGTTVSYPDGARHSGIQGKVFLTFVVEKDGSLANIKVLRSPNEELTEEAVRVLKLSPKWAAGRQHGIPVRQQYTVPISFALSAY